MKNDQKTDKTKPFNIMGGKHLISNHIFKFLDIYNYDFYIEPFIGSGTLFFYNSCISYNSKTKIIINDTNENICNFYKVLRNNPGDLHDLIKYTPYSTREFDSAVTNLNNMELSDIERAKNFYFFMRGKISQRSIHEKKHTLKINLLNSKFHALYIKLDKFDMFHKFLQNTLIECRDAIDLVDHWLTRIYKDQTVLVYLDPPYLASVCNTPNIYNEELIDSDDYHERLLSLLNKYKNKRNIHIIISGYKSKLYDKYLKRWYVKKYKVPLPSSTTILKTKQRYNYEYLWANVKWDKFLKNYTDDVYQYIVDQKFNEFTLTELFKRVYQKKKFIIKTTEKLKGVLDKLVEEKRLFMNTYGVVCNEKKGYKRKVVKYSISSTKNLL